MNLRFLKNRDDKLPVNRGRQRVLCILEYLNVF